jgi:hypothetical protein
MLWLGTFATLASLGVNISSDSLGDYTTMLLYYYKYYKYYKYYTTIQLHSYTTITTILLYIYTPTLQLLLFYYTPTLQYYSS